MIAAGFQYREIGDVSCLPDCFSRPVSEYAIYLNDFMMHRVRNELLVPFITRLPGTSDAPWSRRSAPGSSSSKPFAVSSRPSLSEIWRKPKLAARCRAVQLFEQVSPAMAKAQAVLPLECAKQALKGLRGCLHHPDLRVGSPCSAAAQAAALSFQKGSVRVPIEKSGKWPPSSSRKPSSLGEITGIDDPVAAAQRLERAKVLTAPV